MVLVFSPTACLDAFINFVKFGNTVKKRFNFLCFEIDKWYIKLFVFYHRSKITEIQTKIGIHLCPQGSKVCLQNLIITSRLNFRPLRSKVGPNFPFYVLFLISNKNKEFDISHKIWNFSILKSKILAPFLQCCQISQTWVKHLNEQSNRKQTSFSVSGWKVSLSYTF